MLSPLPLLTLEKALFMLPISNRILAFIMLKHQHREALTLSQYGTLTVDIIKIDEMIINSDDLIELFDADDTEITSAGARILIQMYLYGLLSKELVAPYDQIDRRLLRYAYTSLDIETRFETSVGTRVEIEPRRSDNPSTPPLKHG